jgi:hypothetical protein
MSYWTRSYCAYVSYWTHSYCTGVFLYWTRTYCADISYWTRSYCTDIWTEVVLTIPIFRTDLVLTIPIFRTKLVLTIPVFHTERVLTLLIVCTTLVLTILIFRTECRQHTCHHPAPSAAPRECWTGFETGSLSSTLELYIATANPLSTILAIPSFMWNQCIRWWLLIPPLPFNRPTSLPVLHYITTLPPPSPRPL